MASGEYSKRLNRVIPGGAHTYSRGDDQFPANAPEILERGAGAYVWDPSGTRYLDYGMGLRAVTVGYANEAIVDAAVAEIRRGNGLTRASLTELRAAEALVDAVPSADMVKFAKNGSTVTTAAVKLARAYTGRDLIAICGDHPFFSYDDWFIGSTALVRGIPESTRGLTLKFKYNDIASVTRLFEENPGRIACVILEPAVSESPCPDDCPKRYEFAGCRGCSCQHRNFLHQLSDVCRNIGAVFILDEMITGFRWSLGGAQECFGIKPDLSTFGKAMANGFSVAALTGKREIMELGGILRDGAERVFLTSTTHGGEMCGLGAMLKTLEVYRELGVVEHLWTYGRKLIDGMNAVARECGVHEQFQMFGYPCSPAYVTRDAAGSVSLEFRTLFSQEMVRGGVLIPWVALSLAHDDAALDLTLTAARAALQVYQKALQDGIGRFLDGRAIRPVFRRFN